MRKVCGRGKGKDVSFQIKNIKGGGLLQAVDIYRSNLQEEIQAKANKWYSKGYLIEYEFQEDAYASGRHIIIAFVIKQEKKYF